MKRIISIILSLCLMLSMAQFPVMATTSITESEVLTKISYLLDKLGGKFFTVHQNACPYKGHETYTSGDNCCHNKDVMQATWFKNLFNDQNIFSKFPTSVEHYDPTDYKGSPERYQLGRSCHGFATFAFWYIFGYNSSSFGTEYVVTTKEDSTAKFNKETLEKYAKPGDLIRINKIGASGGHSVIYIGCDSNGISVLDCNWWNTCKVEQHYINSEVAPSWYGGDIAITRASNYNLEETPVLVSGTCGDNVTWTLSNNGKLTLSGSGATYDYDNASDVPWYSYANAIETIEITGAVTRIGNYLFEYCTSLTNITIPNTVTSIGDEAFVSCDSLKSVTIPDSVKIIGKSAFAGCINLTNLALGNGVKTIGSSAFAGCRFENITIPDSLNAIGDQAFFASGLTSIVIPDSVTEIGYYAFAYCDSLTSVTISENVTSIDDYAFDSCSDIEEFIVDEKNPNYYSDENGVLFNKDKTTLLKYPAGKAATEYTIADGVTTIGVGAFDCCNFLTSVTIPDSVTEIGYYAFDGCNFLSDVYYGGTEEQKTAISIGSNNSNLTNATWHYTCDHKYDNACDTSCNVCGVTRTTTHTYDNSSDATCNVCGAIRNIAVTSVSLNKTTVTLNVGESVTLTATVAPTTATNKTVSWSSSNTNVATVSNGKVTAKSAGTATITVTTADGNKTVTCIVTVKNPVLASGTCGDNVTWSLSDKGNLTLSGSGDTYDYESNIDVPWYSYIDSIKTIEITGAVTSIGDYLFYGMSNVERGISIPDTVTSIGYRAYSKCLNVKSITIPDSVTLIGEEAFFDCKGLTEIVVDENNEYYSSVQGVLFNKEKTTLIQYPISRTATSYTIPDSVISIDRLAFYCCPFLTSITIPNGVISIGNMAFYCCSSLTSIIIPDSMTSIGDYAFYWCDVLADVYYGGTEEQKMAISIGRENSCLTNATWHFTLCDNGHTYNNACDASCNVCGETRTTTHKYDNACDAKCNVCNTTRTVGSHVYDGEYDIGCNECGNKKGVVNRSTPIDILRQLYTQVNPSQLPNFSEEEWTFYYDILVARGWSATAAQTEIDYHKAEIAELKVQAEDPTWVSPDYSRNIIIDNCIKYEKSTSSCIYVSGYTWNLLAGLDVDSFSIRGPISLPNSELREQVENSVDDMYVTFHKGIDYDSTNVVTDQNYYFLVRTKFLASSADYSPNLYKGYDAVRRVLNDDSISPVIFRLDWYNWARNPFTGGQLTVKLTEDWVNNYGDNAVSVYRIDGYSYTQDNDPILVPVKQNIAIEDTETREVTFDVKGAQRLYDSYAIVNTNKSVPSTTHVYDNDCDTDCNECGATRTTTHVYDNDCDTDCNECGATRTTTHEYDNDCDADCNVCGATRTVGEHVYDNDCDTSCNVCGATRTVSGHKYDNPCDTTCNICNATRTVSGHKYDNDCDTSCNNCGATRSITHKYDNACDTSCNVCGATRTVSGHKYDNDCDTSCNNCGATRSITHKYDNACDTSCNVCGATRTTSHKYDNACDADCNVCGTTRTVGEHVYDNDKDTTCNECGDIREVATPDIDMPAFVVENKTAKVGDTFTVDVSIKNNSGIISLRNYIGYDSNILELVSATAGDNFSDTSFGPTTKNPFNIIWDDSLASSNNTTNGVVATLTFKVKEGVEACDTEITLTYKSEDVYDFNWDNVEFGVENGTITVIDYISGDVNGDGIVNNKDMGLLRRWLNDWDVEIDELASDVNRDGNVNNKDLGLLRRYLNDWDVVLK